MNWRKKDLEYLRENYSKNRSMKEMSSVLRKTIRAIHHKASREGLFRPRFPSDKPSNRSPRKIIDRRYYENNKAEVYRRKKGRRERLKNELVELLGGKCKICGYSKCYAALEFHHHKKDKENCVSIFLKNSSRQKSLKEAIKCTLLCANCHRELHHGGHS